ncbi:SDR family NAD(P)-dependent oxidoreductase [Alteromonas facilis]|uniref:SDR family NAD(P)-dependent oxidoreductase n=1 Tax=Alteromonas facilis TaxID=2048004 RepID=UPI000C287C4B|nr:glucose 1-dehydrogenase [Alteromonas facilis]
MDPLLNFENKTVLITGAASGFGRLLAQAFAARGANLVLGDINESGLQETVDGLSVDPARVLTMRNDVSKEADCAELVKQGVSKFGTLDYAINNAGIAHDPAATHELTEEVFDKQMNVNVKGVLFGMKYQIPVMLANGGGHVLNVSSMAGLGGAPRGGAYVAAKHAVAGLTRTAAVEYGRKNVRVNAICPYFSPTNILNVDGFNTDEDRARMAFGSPMKRLGEPQEMVNVMVLMLSPGNTYMNGQTIAVDGGVSAW